MRHTAHPALCLAALLLFAAACADGDEVTGPLGSAGANNDGSGTLTDGGGADGSVASVDDGTSGSDLDTLSGQVGLDGAMALPDGAILLDDGAVLLADGAVVSADSLGTTGGATDAGPVDTKVPPVDAGKAADTATGPDAGWNNESNICKTALTQFDDLQAKALQCDTPFQCTKPGPEGVGCPCERYYSYKTFDYQNLSDVSSAALKKGCLGKCLPEPCAPMAPLVGVCQGGTCYDYDAPCKELDEMAALAVTEGVKCTKDEQCVFGANVDLKCGCSQFLNMDTMGPGKPLFGYMMMLVQAYTFKGCAKGVECGCLLPLKATCKAGVCVTEFKTETP